MTGPAPSIVAFTLHAERRAVERRLVLHELAELVLERHDRRLRNPGDADWVIRTAGVAIVYDWPHWTRRHDSARHQRMARVA